MKIPLRAEGRQTQFLVGLWLIFLAAIFFSLMNLGIRLASGQFSPAALVFWRSLVQVLIVLPFVSGWKGRFIPKSPAERVQKAKAHFLRGALGIVSIYCLYHADQMLPLGLANLLVATVVFWSVIFARIFLNEKLTRTQAGWCGAATLGVMFGSLHFGHFGASGNWGASVGGVLVALASGLMAGLALTVLRHMRKNLDTKEIVFYFGLSGVIGFLPGMLLHPRYPVSLNELALVLGIGLAGSIAQLLMTHSFRYLPAGVATVVHLEQTVFSALLGMIFFAEIPPWNFAVGAIIVFVALFGLARSRHS